MELSDFLLWMVGPGAGVIAFLLIEEVPYLATLKPKIKYLAGLAVPGVLAALGYLGMVAMGYSTTPGDAKTWIEALFLVCSGPVVSQVAHKFSKL